MYGAFTLSGRLSQNLSTVFLPTCCSPNPRMHAFWFGLFRFRSPLLTESILFLFLRLLRCFSSPGSLPYVMYWRMDDLSAGFPHSDICGSLDICSSPQLFAAYHVFHRLLVPRHPPCALSCLTVLRSCVALHELLLFLRYLSITPYLLNNRRVCNLRYIGYVSF